MTVIPLRSETPEQAAAERGGELPADVDPCTDLANAHRLAAMHGGDLLFTRALEWVGWDGKRYAPDETGMPCRCAQNVARAVRRQSSGLLDRAAKTSEERRKKLEKEAKWLFSWGCASQQEPKLRAALKVASSLETFAVLPSVFDRDPMLLNVANGTVDLGTGELRDHDRADRITKLAKVELLDDWGCPTFLAFLGRIFDGKQEVIDFVQRAAGYSLTGSTGEQCFFMLWGSTGANGKSTLLETLRHVFGDYACNSSPDVLMTKPGSRGPENDVARLRGARLVTASESGESRRLDEERVKRLTGGDTYTARFLHKEYFEFRPEFKLWLSANNRPEIKGTDNAIWRRVRLIPFEVTIPETEQDPELPAKLQKEAPGILRWAVDGCLEWRSGGLRPPAAVTDATAGYRSEQDTLGRFFGDECTLMGSLRTKTGVLYERYCDWCRETGEEAMAQRTLGGRLRDDERFQPDKDNQGRWWVGIGLNAKDDAGRR